MRMCESRVCQGRVGCFYSGSLLFDVVWHGHQQVERPVALQRALGMTSFGALTGHLELQACQLQIALAAQAQLPGPATGWAAGAA